MFLYSSLWCVLVFLLNECLIQPLKYQLDKKYPIIKTRFDTLLSVMTYYRWKKETAHKMTKSLQKACCGVLLFFFPQLHISGHLYSNRFNVVANTSHTHYTSGSICLWHSTTRKAKESSFAAQLLGWKYWQALHRVEDINRYSIKITWGSIIKYLNNLQKQGSSYKHNVLCILQDSNWTRNSRLNNSSWTGSIEKCICTVNAVLLKQMEQQMGLQIGLPGLSG